MLGHKILLFDVPLDRFKCKKMPITLFPEWIVKHYDLM